MAFGLLSRGMRHWFLLAAVVLAAAPPAAASGYQVQPRPRAKEERADRGYWGRHRGDAVKGRRLDVNRRVVAGCTLRVQAQGAPINVYRREPVFSARAAGDLRFDLWVRASQSSEPSEIRIYTPNRELFKVLRADASQTPSGRLAERLSRRGLSVLSARLPLVGTHVTRRALYGTWRAEASFVDSDADCTRPLDFDLQP